MLPHVCQLFLVLFNGCNNIPILFPQVTNNSDGTYQLQAPSCNCSCTNYPNIINMCQMANVTIPPCTMNVSDVSESTTLLPTTLDVMTPSTEDDDIFNDQARKKKTTTKMPTSSVSTTTPTPITSTMKSTSILVTDSPITPNPPDSSNLEKDKLSTQTTIDARKLSTTPSSTRDVPLLETTTPAAPELSSEKSTAYARSTVSIDSTVFTQNLSTSKSDTTTTSKENISLTDQSSTSSSISTTQSSSSKTSKSLVRSSTTPRFESSTVPEENAPTKDNSDNTSPTESSSTSNWYTDATTQTFQTSTIDREITTTIDYISSSQKPDKGKVSSPLFTTTEISTTISLNSQSSPTPIDTTRFSTQTEKNDDDISTTVKYSTTDASILTTQYDETSADSTTKLALHDDVTTTPFRINLLPTMTTEENEETFNDKAGKRRKTTKIPTTSESIESSSTPYSMTRATSELTTESPDIISTTSSITEFISTTQPFNDSNCDLIDQPDKSIDPMNDTELTSLGRMKRSLFSYGIELSKIILQNDTANVALSPTSFALLLAMVRSGCRSSMKEDIDKILNLNLNATDNRLKLFKSIVDSVHNITNNASVEVYIANKMYLPNDVVVNPKFIRFTGIIFKSEPQTIDFSNVNSTVEQLNYWSANSTNDKIPVFADLNRLDPSTSMLLTSVAYFSGNWSNPFDRQFTSKNLFYADDGTVKKVCTMLQVNKFRYGELPDLKAEFVELPFESGDNHPLSMIIMIPTNETSLNPVIKSLNKLTYSQLIANSSVEVVELSLPKFRIESVIDLAENPEKFGLTNVTNHSHDFKCVLERKPLQISHIIQKTVIDVHEGGCWKVPMNYICPQEENSCRNTSSIKFVVNQPFIVLVVSSDMILFSGRVNDPTIKSVNNKV